MSATPIVPVQRAPFASATRPRTQPHLHGRSRLKYCPAFPGEFGCLADARAFSEVFFTYYNNKHRHSGIGLHTPASVHDGTATEIQARRALVLQQAYATSPKPCRRCPNHRGCPARVWINQPPATIETDVTPQKN